MKANGNNGDHVMSLDRFRRLMRLAAMWGDVCIVCGEPFAHAACITREHIVPQSLMDNVPSLRRKGKIGNSARCANIAPSHYKCNSERGNLSLVEAARKILKTKERMSPANFHSWLNQPAPNRVKLGPPHILYPYVDAVWFTFK